MRFLFVLVLLAGCVRTVPGTVQIRICDDTTACVINCMVVEGRPQNQCLAKCAIQRDADE